MARKTMRALSMFKSTGAKTGSKFVRRKTWKK
jgi:hypothetical protein